MQVHDLLIQSATDCPNAVAAVCEERMIRYHELNATSDRIASYLKDLGTASGNRAAILYENSLEYLVVFFGILKAGLVAVPLDTSLSSESLAAIIEDCQAEVLFAQPSTRRKLIPLLAAVPSVKHLISETESMAAGADRSYASLVSITGPVGERIVAADCGSSHQPPTVTDLKRYPLEHTLAAIFYTSGSTGAGKGVMLSHLNLVHNTLGTIEYLKLSVTDSVMVILPFYYIYGNSLLLTHIAVGGRLVIDNRFLYPEVVLDTMQQQEVTGFSGVPSNFQILLGNSSFAARRFPSLRYLTQAGGAMATETIRRLLAVFPDKEIYIMYGQTEASPRISFVPPEMLAEKVGSVGIPLPGIRVLVVDEDDRELPAGKTGEVVVIGDNVMMGYWNQPEENMAVLRDGRLWTGDLGMKDADGYLYIVGRKKEIIKCGGNRVSAREVEDCLLAHEKVLEATVFAVPDALLGEAVKAVVVLKNGKQAEARELIVHCRSKMADYKVPKYMVFADCLPKYQSGKVNKLQLRSEHQ